MLAGKNAIVTGSSAGIGRGIAKAFAKEGAFVFVNGRSESSVKKAIDEIVAEGVDASLLHGVVADISTVDGSNAFFANIEATGRQIDILVNNMGIFGTSDFFEQTDEEWMNYFNVNVLSTVRFCRKYMKPMLERNSGRIIIVSSECGVRPIPDMLPYAMTKAAQLNVARGLAELTKGTKVTVNSLLPGPTATEGVNAFVEGIAKTTNESIEQTVKSYFSAREPTSLIQRFLTVEEVANVATFLASDLSSGINGTAQLVDGGIIRHI